MMEPVLLELDPAKVVDVSRVPFHFFEDKFHLRLSDDLLFIHSDNARSLLKLSGATAPTRPNTEPHIVNRQNGSRDNVDDANERLHPVEFAADIFAKHAAL